MKKKKPRKPGKGPEGDWGLCPEIYEWGDSHAVNFPQEKYGNPEDIRKLAAWLIKAADWIEALRPEGQ